ncbi:MAG: mannonate dehydratase, partial [Pseudomonadota bacterium]
AELVADRAASGAPWAPIGGGAGLTWDVIESLPVSEAIKTQTGPWRQHLEAYRQSLRHIAALGGPRVVCYNFMPVLDWTRTDLRHSLGHGGTAMSFDAVDFAVFDLILLARLGAPEDWPRDVQEAARARHAGMDDRDCDRLVQNVVAGLPGAHGTSTMDDVRDHLSGYASIGATRLRQHLIDFLAEVAPTAKAHGLRLCAHPDDPPYPLLGLPRILSTEADYAAFLDAVDLPASGMTFCTGSLGVRPDFDPAGVVARLGSRIHFVHLRNTRRQSGVAPPSFVETAHLDGDTDMVVAIGALMREERRRKAEGRADAEIPMRPDHGHALLGDLDRPMMPGYPLIGRLRGLAELRGVMAAFARSGASI